MQPHITHSQEQLQEIPYGYCQCGCGQLAPIAKKTDRSSGRIKGEPQRYIMGHQNRKSPFDSSGKRICCKCGEAKTLDHFWKDKRRRDGMHPQCKSCCKKYADVYNKQYWRKNKEARTEYNRIHHLRYYKLHREHKLLYRRKYYLANKSAHRAQDRKYRARLMGAEGSHTAEDVTRQYAAQKGKCYYCKKKVGDKYHVDHVIPLSRGGSNGPENLVIACPTCNTSKHDKLPHEWAQGNRLL